MKYIILFASFSFFLTGCLDNKKVGNKKPTIQLASKMYHFPKEPAENKITPEKIELGKMLYFDPRLSIDGTISCNSCHNVMNGGSDNRAVSMGVKGQRGGRSAPTVFNAAFLSVQFWDGRANDLEEQSIGPPTNSIEMGMPDHNVMMDRIKKIPGYVEAFKKVFGGGEEVIILDNLAKAIATYERTLITTNSPYDQFVAGNNSALSENEKKGWESFKQVGCNSCHSGNHFAGPELPIGQGFFQKFPTYPNSEIENLYKFTKDTGRMDATKIGNDRNMWRVPTLRNIELTAPYFHNGAVANLTEAVRVMAKLQLNVDLNDEQNQSIVVFLKSLTGKLPVQTMPVLPPTSGKAATEMF